MPTYNFRNKETGEITSISLRISELDVYKENNPTLETVISAPNLVSGSGGIKNDSGWKENMSRIAEAHPGSPLADRFGDKNIKREKTRNVLNKHNFGSE